MWLFFAILAPVCWAMSNAADSVLSKVWVKNNLVLTLFFALTRLPLALVLLFVFRHSLLMNGNSLIMFLSGVFWMVPYIFYYKALQHEDASRVILIMQFIPVFNLIVAVFLIGDVLNFQQMLAFILILSGSILAAIKKIESKWRFSKSFVLVLLASFIWAFSDVVFKKYAVYFPSFWSGFVFFILGSSLPAFFMFLLPKYSKELIDFKNLPKNGVILLLISAIFGTIGSVVFSYALTLGRAALTAVVIGIQPLLVLIFGKMLRVFFKEVPEEFLSKFDLLIKFCSFVLIMVGLAYLYL